MKKSFVMYGQLTDRNERTGRSLMMNKLINVKIRHIKTSIMPFLYAGHIWTSGFLSPAAGLLIG